MGARVGGGGDSLIPESLLVLFACVLHKGQGLSLLLLSKCYNPACEDSIHTCKYLTGFKAPVNV